MPSYDRPQICLNARVHSILYAMDVGNESRPPAKYFKHICFNKLWKAFRHQHEAITLVSLQEEGSFACLRLMPTRRV